MLSDLDLEDRPVVLGRFAELLPHGRYRAVSLSLSPQLIEEGSAEDFFQRERRAFGWNLPDDEGDDGPDTDYYRAGLYDRGGEPLYVFVVPLQLPETLHEGTVTRYRTDLAEGKTPTVVTFGVLYRNWLYANMSRPLVGDPDGPTRAEVLGAAAGHFASIDSYWTLTLFVLDGHHKLAAAAHDGAPMDLLSLVWEGPDPRLLDEVFPPIEGPAPRPAQAQ